MAQVTPEEILAGHNVVVRDIAERLRRLILEAAPEMIEKGYSGWHGIGYTHPRAGYVCAIFVHDTGVKLGFEHGASLHDPDGRLRQGASKGKQVRYLELRETEDVDPDVILSFLVDAIRLKS
ncbi:MAG: DUF1801 domain-containing protein [Anaerolineae bacterium]|nr:DUF1801 domain-containing protein [Anaerolineae bacterium]